MRPHACDLLIGAMLLVPCLVGTGAVADDSECADLPQERWRSELEAEARAVALGYEVRRVTTDDGCYLVKGFDRNGARIELKLDPADLAVVRHDDDRDDDDDGRDRAAPHSPWQL
jgi:hypothetical protein